jgi:hypothetical protein
MLPKRGGHLRDAVGFTVSPSARLKPKSRQPVLHTVAEALAYVRKQDPGVRANGLWIVVTNPDAYPDDEKTLLENFSSMCRREKIPLFICRASQLPDGWTRADR